MTSKSIDALKSELARYRVIATLRESFANADGYRDGYRDGLSKMLTPVLVRKFGRLSDPYRARIATASPRELDTWADRVLTSTSLEQVFAD